MAGKAAEKNSVQKGTGMNRILALDIYVFKTIFPSVCLPSGSDGHGKPIILNVG